MSLHLSAHIWIFPRTMVLRMSGRHLIWFRKWCHESFPVL